MEEKYIQEYAGTVGELILRYLMRRKEEVLRKEIAAATGTNGNHVQGYIWTMGKRGIVNLRRHGQSLHVSLTPVGERLAQALLEKVKIEE